MQLMRALAGPALLLLLIAGCKPPEPQSTTSQTAAPPPAAAPKQSPVERGKYMVTVGGCNDCHTPKKLGPNGPEPDMSKELSGNPSTEKLAPVPAGLIAPDKYLTVVKNHLCAWGGPWGVGFATNPTPDKAAGLGSWPQNMF